MKLSTKSRYGARAMVDLAQHYGKGPIKIHEISGRQDVSEYYLQQILSTLSKANLVNSTAGSHGGFSLAASPEKITLLEILEVLEGSLSLVNCVESPHQCDRSDTCCTRWAWCMVSDQLKSALKGITLEQLVKKQKVVAA